MISPSLNNVRFLSPQEIVPRQEQLVEVYRAAFRPPPYNKPEREVAEFAWWLPRHLEREGFRLVAALAGENGPITGFAYGFTNGPERWWYQQVAQTLSPQAVVTWLDQSFQLAEMAVHPAVQGQGLGGQLHDRLLGTVPQRRAVLSTMAAETIAFRMYQRRGWVTLLDHFQFSGVKRPYRIMGLVLGK